MKIRTLLIACLCVLLACSARAEFYISGGAGISKNTGSAVKTDSGAKGGYQPSSVYSLAFGYDLPFIDIVRVEGEYFHNRAKVRKGLGYADMNALMANAYVDVPFVLPLITPYVGAGIGYGRFEKDNVMPMQLMLGLDAEVFVIPVVGSLEYRYMQTNRSAKSSRSESKYYGHILMAKLRYEF